MYVEGRIMYITYISIKHIKHKTYNIYLLLHGGTRVPLVRVLLFLLRNITTYMYVLLHVCTYGTGTW